MSKAQRAPGESTTGTVGEAHKADALGEHDELARVRAVGALGVPAGSQGACRGRAGHLWRASDEGTWRAR